VEEAEGRRSWVAEGEGVEELAWCGMELYRYSIGRA
jgi:hypothetical protein